MQDISMAWGSRLRPWITQRGLLVAAIITMGLLTVVSGLATENIPREEILELREEVREMFYHAYNGYMEHAFPLDELRPLSCNGEDTLGGYSLTLIDAMDTLALLGNRSEFAKAVRWASENLDFDKDVTVSVFETNIRILGGLLSAHLLASDPATGMQVDAYNNTLLRLAEDLASRMLPAFDTPTGIPYGSVNLRHGVHSDETKVTSTAGGGTLALEFGMLSRITGNPVFEEAAKNAVRGLWAQRSNLGLVGGHINVFTGEWTHKDAGIGTSIDSFYEYLLKAHLLLGDDEYLHMFNEAYKAAMRFLHQDPWYVEVNMNSALLVWPLFNSLQAFWPGLQVLVGDIEPAVRTHKVFYGVWRKFGFTPEGYNLGSGTVQPGQRSYPLRPELAESTYWLYRATQDPLYLHIGRDMVASLQNLARCPCGFCHIANVETHEQDDHMESFFLSETVKYLWLLFDAGAGGDNFVKNGPHPYVFTTEGHLFPIKPEFSLLSEHCTYQGSPCRKFGTVGDATNTESTMNEKKQRSNEGQKGRDVIDLDEGDTQAVHASGGRDYRDDEEHPEQWEVARSRGRLAAQSLAGLCPKPSFWRKIGLEGPTDGDALMKTVPQRQSDRADRRILRFLNMVTSRAAAQKGSQKDSREVVAESDGRDSMPLDDQQKKASKGEKRRRDAPRMKIVESEKVFGGVSAAVIQIVAAGKENGEMGNAKEAPKSEGGGGWTGMFMSVALPGLIWMYLSRGKKETGRELAIRRGRVAPEHLYLSTVHEEDEGSTEGGSSEGGSTEGGSGEDRDIIMEEEVAKGKPDECSSELAAEIKDDKREGMEKLNRVEAEWEVVKEEEKGEVKKEELRDVGVVSKGDVRVVSVQLLAKAPAPSSALHPQGSGTMLDFVLMEEKEAKKGLQRDSETGGGEGDFSGIELRKTGGTGRGGDLEGLVDGDLQQRIAMEEELAGMITLQTLSAKRVEKDVDVGKCEESNDSHKGGRGTPRLIPSGPNSVDREEVKGGNGNSRAGGEATDVERRGVVGSGNQICDVGVVEGSPASLSQTSNTKSVLPSPKGSQAGSLDADNEKLSQWGNRSWWVRGRSRDLMRRLKWFRRDSSREIEWEEEPGRKWKGDGAESNGWFSWARGGKASGSETATGARMTRRLSSKLWVRVFGSQRMDNIEVCPEAEGEERRGWMRGRVARLWSVLRRDRGSTQGRLGWDKKGDKDGITESGELGVRTDSRSQQHSTGKVDDDKDGKDVDVLLDAHGKNGLWQFGRKSSKKKVDVAGVEGPWGVDGGVAGCGGFMCMPVRSRRGSRQLDFRG